MWFSKLEAVSLAALAVAVTAFTPTGITLAQGGRQYVDAQSRTRASWRLGMAVEEVSGTAALLESAPLFLAPIAALAAGRQALADKERLELDVYATEIELEDIKQKLKASQLQITVGV
mgnify:CR=1 FL=1